MSSWSLTDSPASKYVVLYNNHYVIMISDRRYGDKIDKDGVGLMTDTGPSARVRENNEHVSDAAIVTDLVYLQAAANVAPHCVIVNHSK